jgi:hypothetical protein
LSQYDPEVQHLMANMYKAQDLMWKAFEKDFSGTIEIRFQTGRVSGFRQEENLPPAKADEIDQYRSTKDILVGS